MRIRKRFSGVLAVVCLVVLFCGVVLPASALAADGASKDKGSADNPVQTAASGAASSAGASQSDKADSSQPLAMLIGMEKMKRAFATSDDGKPEGARSGDTSGSGQPESTPPSRTPQAQSTGQTTQQQTAQNPITQPLAQSPEVGRERVGVDLNQVEHLTLQDAIATALKNNLGIENSRQAVRIAQYNLFAAKGAYDVTSSANINFNDATSPTTFVFQGAVNGAISQKVLTYNFSTSQLVQATGGQWTATFNNNRLTSNALSQTLSPQFNSNLQFQFIQPLMRNLSIDSNRRQIAVLKRQLDVSDSQFRQEVIQIINQVQDAYWNLVFAIRNEKIARDTVELTRTQLENDRKQVEAGTAAPIDLRSDEAALEARKGDVIIALQNVTTAENVVKGLLLKDPTDNMWNSVLDPTDEPQFGQPTLSVDEALRVALKNRPELDQLRLQSQIYDTQIKFFKNQLKPQVDFVGLYTTAGLAGSQTPASIAQGSVLPNQLIGSYGQDLRNLFGMGFRTWQVGVQISLPWGNHTAKANLGAALAQSRQTDTQIRQEMQQIEMDVRNALQAVEAQRRSYLAAKAGRIAAEAQYQGTVEKFRAGLTTNFFVLQYQTDLASAEGSEVRALTNYDIALANLQAVTGMTLISNNVKVKSPKDGSVK